MANILLTEKCVRECPYCFAQKYMDDGSDKFLSWKNLVYLADMLERTNENHISLLGGEPTLHPDFSTYVLYLMNRGFHVTIFTAGIMSNRQLKNVEEDLSGVDPGRLSFVVNTNHPDITPVKEMKSQNLFLKKMGHMSCPGHNLYQEEFELDFIFDYINRFNLRRHIRLGIGHPIYGKENNHVTPPRMKKIAESLERAFPLFEANKVTPGFDCGMPLCIFEDESLGKLMKLSGNAGAVKFGCGPAIDVGPNMDVWSCFPLTDYKRKSVFEFDDFRQVAEYFAGILNSVRTEKKAGIFDECTNCLHREKGTCAGGCVAHGLIDSEAENIESIQPVTIINNVQELQSESQ